MTWKSKGQFYLFQVFLQTSTSTIHGRDEEIPDRQAMVNFLLCHLEFIHFGHEGIM